jgi:hypothetical protein
VYFIYADSRWIHFGGVILFSDKVVFLEGKGRLVVDILASRGLEHAGTIRVPSNVVSESLGKPSRQEYAGDRLLGCLADLWTLHAPFLKLDPDLNPLAG